MAAHGLGRAFLVRSLPSGLVPDGETPTVDDYGIAARNDIVFAPNHGDALLFWERSRAASGRAFATVQETTLV